MKAADEVGRVARQACAADCGKPLGRWLAGLLLACVAVMALAPALIGPAHAQAGALTVHLARPGEGETFYAGPTAILYNMSINGWVTGFSRDAREIQLRLDILQDGAVVGSGMGAPLPDTTFAFYAMVNPMSSPGQFLEDRRFYGMTDGCGGSCHSPIAGTLGVPPGDVLIRVTATDVDGRQAAAERHITVDQAGYASLPVHVDVEDQPAHTVAGLRVSAAALMYMWRGRTASAATDAQGNALLEVEALSQAPTHYYVRVEPSVVDGRQYYSVEPAEVTLPAGAATAPTVTLRVRSRAGQITGRLARAVDAQTPLSVAAVRLPQGDCYRAEISDGQTFAFAELPVGEYLLTLDRVELARRGWSTAAQRLDLSKAVTTTIELPLTALGGASLHGTVRDEGGVPLPFAWVDVDRAGAHGGVSPTSGMFDLPGLPAETLAVVVSAPGYYSQAHAAKPGGAGPLELTLTRRPETRQIPWGDGWVTVPAESDATSDGQAVVLRQGWLWGRSQGGEAQTIRTPRAAIVLHSGAFALQVGPGEDGWLYVTGGEATVEGVGQPAPLVVRAGEMLALTGAAPMKAVVLDPLAVEALRPVGGSPLGPVWEPNIRARVRDGLALAGIGAAQAVTLLIYSMAILMLVLLPVTWLVSWMRRRARRAGSKADG